MLCVAGRVIVPSGMRERMNRPDIITEIAIDEGGIRRCIRRLAREIVADYPLGSKVLAVVVLEGARRLAEDLLREFLAHTSARFELAYISARSYQDRKSVV